MVDPDSIDALSALAPLFRVQPELQSLCRFGAQWASVHDREEQSWAPFHMVTSGACVLDVDGEPPALLGAGDIVLLPHGDPHVVRGEGTARGTRPRVQIRVQVTSAIEVRSNTNHPEAELICGRLTFEQKHNNLARAALPRVILLKTAENAAGARLQSLLTAIREELEAAGPGARAICCDLASALLVMVLRTHFQRHVLEDGLLKLLGQRQTARALAAMMDQPARPWSLDEIAAVAKTSRATLVRDFRHLAKTTPFGVLAELRLGIARHSLLASDRSLADIAADVGYQSQSAFSRAFQRRFRRSPSEVRDAGA